MRRMSAAAILVLAVAAVSAHSGHDSHELPETAVTPDHPLYDAKLSVEKQIEQLAPNETAEAQAKLETAETRLAETETLVSQNKTDLANMTANNYSEKMKELQGFGEQASSLAQQRKIDQLVANATLFHTEVLSKVYERVPQQAKAGIQKALNSSVTGYQQAVDNLNRTGGVPQNLQDVNITSKVPEEVRGKVGKKSERGEDRSGSSGQSSQGQQNGSQGSGNY